MQKLETIVSPDIQEQLMTKLVTYLESTEAFMTEQAPIFIQELLTWYKAIHWFGFTGFILLFILVSVATVITFKYARKQYNVTREIGYDMLVTACCLLGPILSVIFFIISMSNLVILIKLYTAPRLFLLEKIMDIVNGSG